MLPLQTVAPVRDPNLIRRIHLIDRVVGCRFLALPRDHSSGTSVDGA